MPINSVNLVGSTPELLTPSDVVTFTLQNVGERPLRIAGAVGANVPPTDGSVAFFRVEPGFGFENKAIADLFPGLSGVNRLYGWSESDSTPAKCTVSHA